MHNRRTGPSAAWSLKVFVSFSYSHRGSFEARDWDRLPVFSESQGNCRWRTQENTANWHSPHPASFKTGVTATGVKVCPGGSLGFERLLATRHATTFCTPLPRYSQPAASARKRIRPSHLFHPNAGKQGRPAVRLSMHFSLQQMNATQTKLMSR